MSSVPPDLSAGKPIGLSAGPLSMLYENGYVRSLRFGGIEIVRRIYMALRDEHWNTVPGELSSFSIKKNSASFSLSFDSRHRKNDIDFLWHAEIRGREKGEISFAMHGTALSRFRRNRIGLCVLHPLSAKGQSCRVETVDGTVIDASFPGPIAAHPIFMKVRALAYPASGELIAKVRFEGDVFETEDQRNWTDATYKTYSTPLSLPIPALVEKGMTVEQKIIVTIDKAASPKKALFSRDPSGPLRIDFGTARPLRTYPSIGTVASNYTADEPFKAPAISHLRIDLRFETDDVRSCVNHAEHWYRNHALPVEFALHFADDCVSEAAALARMVAAHPFAIARFLVYKNDERSTGASTIAAVHDTLRCIAPDAPIVSGTNGHFLEINRVHPPLDLLDGVCFSATPQVHTFDNTAIMENLPGLLETISAAHGIAGDKSIVLSPLTLRPRKTPDLPEKDGGPDDRTQTLFGAAWTLGAIANCIEGDVSGLTLDEINPKTPTAILLSWLPGQPTERISAVQSSSSDPARVLGVEFVDKNRFAAVAANLTNGDAKVFFAGLPEHCGYVVLDEGSFKKIAGRTDGAAGLPVEKLHPSVTAVSLLLPPYALVKFEGVV